MTYPIKIGVHKDISDKEIHEYLIATGDGGACAGRAGRNVIWNVNSPILGYIDITTGRKSSIAAHVNWDEPDENVQSRSYVNYFKPRTVYRVKGYVNELREGEEYNKWNSNINVTEILSEGEENEFLKELAVEWDKPITIESEMFGQMTYDKDLEFFSGSFNWLGSEIDVSIDAEPGAATEVLYMLEDLCRSCADWDKKFRECAARYLTDLANDWLCDADEPEITREEFAARIGLCTVDMNEEGEFSAWFDDDDIFAGHSVVVHGTLDGGVEEATMEG